MKKETTNTIIKVVMLTGVFFVLINYFGYLMNSYGSSSQIKENKYNYENTQIPVIGRVGVAISTNIGTSYKEINETPVNMFGEAVEIGYILSQSKEASQKMISSHMLSIGEYFNILKTDIKGLLQSNYDRQFVLNSFIAQLEYRYKTTITNISTLESQKKELLDSYNKSNSNIAKIKNELSTNFSNLDPTSTYQNIENYLELKKENDLARTYIIFIDKFIKQYTLLNSYNKKILDTLINNKDVILKDSYVIIPDTGTQILKDLDLLQTEKDFKSQN